MAQELKKLTEQMFIDPEKLELTNYLLKETQQPFFLS